jgi:hypothetical protein
LGGGEFSHGAFSSTTGDNLMAMKKIRMKKVKPPHQKPSRRQKVNLMDPSFALLLTICVLIEH